MISELTKLVYCSSARTGWMAEYFNDMSKPIQEILKYVTTKQIKKFQRYGRVPVPVLESLWYMGFLPNEKAPKQGMEILELTEYLRHGDYKTEHAREKGKCLYTQIIEEELIGRRIFVKKQEYPTFTIQITLENRAKTSVRAR